MDSSSAPLASFPLHHLMPRAETGATEFVAQHPLWDGRDVVVAVLDTGVDPAADGLQLTLDGKPKLIDTIDASGSGDVDMSTVRDVDRESRTLDGLNGRKLTLPEDWLAKNPSGKVRVGTKRAYDLFPRVLLSRLKAEKRKKWDAAEKQIMAQLQRDVVNVQSPASSSSSTPSTPPSTASPSGTTQPSLASTPLSPSLAADAAAPSTTSTTSSSSSRAPPLAPQPSAATPSESAKAQKEELEAQIDQLTAHSKSLEDCGAVFDCIAFFDGTCWRAAVDTTETGNFESAKLMTNYFDEREFARFGKEDMVSYAFNIYDDGNVLSIVVDAGAHGTHVAGIVAANFPGSPEKNGVAPGAQIVSVKIGDTRLGSMETGTAMVRAITHLRKRKVDIVNMSYGEPSTLGDQGRVLEFCADLVNKHGIVFVSSAGNNGPALTTVGAPGGVSSAIIGVGAYVSGDMMTTDYSMREPGPNTQYTWSSRGPTVDGDLGVCVSAPGAAIAPVPAWTLKANQLMNGTSMSSPNCAGGIALLISALKEQAITNYTPYTIRRAITVTATSVDSIEPFAIGSGLLNIPRAFEYLRKFADTSATSAAHRVHYAVSFPDRDSARGLYLREPSESLKPIEESVAVQPVFNEDEDHDLLVRFERHFQLTCEAKYIQAPSFFVLMNDSRSFHIRVDPTLLPADGGVHFTQILAFDSSEPRECGPVFTIPITIVRPLHVPESRSSDGQDSAQAGSTLELGKLRFHSGRVVRRFIAVPPAATWAEVTLKVVGASLDARRFVCHAVQLQAQKSYRDFEYYKFASLLFGTPSVHRFGVLGGATLELCLAQWWASLGETELSVQVVFHGLQPLASLHTHVHSSDAAVRVDLVSPLQREEISPSVTLKSWQQVLRPFEHDLKPLSATRDVLLDGQQLYEMVLSYRFSQSDAYEAFCFVPSLRALLYESPFEAQFWMVFDANKRLVQCGDAFPDHYSMKLDKGDYVVRLQLRHEKVDVLEKFQDLSIVLERQLSKSHEVSLDVYPTLKAVVTGGARFKATHVAPGSRVPLFVSSHVGSSKLPKECKVGDVLNGYLSLLKPGAVNGANGSVSATSPESIRRHPGHFPVSFHVSSASFGGASAKAAGAAGSSFAALASLDGETTDKLTATVRDAKIGMLAKLRDDKSRGEYDELYKSLKEAHPTHLPLLTAHLHAVDVPERKDRVASLPVVVFAADSVLESVSVDELAAHYGINWDLSVPENGKLRKEMDKKKDVLVDALFRKARALVEMGASKGGSQALVQQFLKRARSRQASSSSSSSSSNNTTVSSPTATSRSASPVHGKKDEAKEEVALIASAAGGIVPPSDLSLYESGSADAGKTESLGLSLSFFPPALDIAGGEASPAAASESNSSAPVTAATASAQPFVPDTSSLDAQFEATVSQLAKWTSLQDSRVCSIYVHREVGKGRYGTALKAVAKQISADSFSSLPVAAQKKLYDTRAALFEKLGWAHMVENEKRMMQVRFPPKYALF